MRLYSRECIAAHAYVVQERMFYTAAPFAVAFIGFALMGWRELATAAAIADSVAIGASLGAWLVARRFED